jgi:hypothetical protein
MEDREEFEHIPWAELTDRRMPAGGRALKIGAALVGAVLLGIVAGRAFGSAGSPATVVPAGDAAPIVIPPTTESSTTTFGAGALPQLPGLYSEADLMALPPAGPERAAATRAEWFVYDYFTADMEPSGSADIVAALPSGAALPEMPQDAVGSLSYVEWARAFDVQEAGEGTYRVGVVFRALGAPPDRGFVRLAARAVEVTVQVSPDGGTAVIDLPAPVPLPAAAEPRSWPDEPIGEAPPAVVDGAILAAAAWGTEPRLIGAQPVEGGWRVVLTIADEVGNRWPVSVRVDDLGSPADRLG